METIFRRMHFKPLVFGKIGEMSSNVTDLVEMAVEYGVEHLERSMAAMRVDTVRLALRRRYKSHSA